MIDSNQIVEVRLTANLRNHYEQLGYNYTKQGDFLKVKAGDLPVNSSVLVSANCDVCGKSVDLPYRNYTRNVRVSGLYRCKSCATTNNQKKKIQYINSREKNYQKFIDLCNKHNYLPLTKIEEFDTIKKTYYRFICPLHGEQTIQVCSMDNVKYGCKQCSNKAISVNQLLNINDVIQLIEKNGNTLVNPEEYVNSRTKNLRVICGDCGCEYLTSYMAQQSNIGISCVSCGIKKVSQSLTLKPEYLDKLYNSEKTVLLNPDEYISNNTSNLKFVCRECGDIFTTTKARFDCGQTRCKKCSNTISVGEDIIMCYLNKNNISFESEKKYDDCRDIRPLPFDFYLSDYNIIIEFDGQHHFFPIHGQEHFEMTKRHDKMKNEYCQKNNIPLIRIPYYRGDQVEKLLNRVLFENNIKMRPMCMVKQ